MSTQVGRGLACAAIAVVTSLAGGCASGSSQPSLPVPRARPVVVATVAGSAISQADVEHWATAIEPSTGVTPALKGERALNFLIFARWLTAEARELGVTVTRSEVKHQTTELIEGQAEGETYPHMPRDAQLRELLLVSSLRRADREWLIELALIDPRVERARLVRARQEVPHDQILRYYAEHMRRFYLPDQRQVEIIGGTPADVAQAKREIEGGKPFLEVARRLSRDPEAPGGLWRLLRGHDEPQVEDPVFAAKLHVLVGPKQYSQTYIFEVLEAIPAHQQSLAEAEDSIRRRLVRPAAQVAAAAEQKWRTGTKCDMGYVVSRCSEYRIAASAPRKQGTRG
jgi:hypothetical protein